MHRLSQASAPGAQLAAYSLGHAHPEPRAELRNLYCIARAPQTLMCGVANVNASKVARLGPYGVLSTARSHWCIGRVRLNGPGLQVESFLKAGVQLVSAKLCCKLLARSRNVPVGL